MKQCIALLVTAALIVVGLILFLPDAQQAQVPPEDAAAQTSASGSQQQARQALQTQIQSMLPRSVDGADDMDIFDELFSRSTKYTLQTPGAPIWVYTTSGVGVNVARLEMVDELMQKTSVAYPLEIYDTHDTRYLGMAIGKTSVSELEMLRFLMMHSPSYLSEAELNAWLSQTGYGNTVTQEEARIAAQLAVYYIEMNLKPADWELNAPSHGSPALTDAYPNVESLLAHYVNELQRQQALPDTTLFWLDMERAGWAEAELFGPMSLQSNMAYLQESFDVEIIYFSGALASAPVILDAGGNTLTHVSIGQPFYLRVTGAKDWDEEMGLYEIRMQSQNALPYDDVLLLVSERAFMDLDNEQFMVSARKFTDIVRLSFVDVLYKEMEK